MKCCYVRNVISQIQDYPVVIPIDLVVRLRNRPVVASSLISRSKNRFRKGQEIKYGRLSVGVLSSIAKLGTNLYMRCCTTVVVVIIVAETDPVSSNSPIGVIE